MSLDSRNHDDRSILTNNDGLEHDTRHELSDEEMSHERISQIGIKMKETGKEYLRMICLAKAEREEQDLEENIQKEKRKKADEKEDKKQQKSEAGRQLVAQRLAERLEAARVLPEREQFKRDALSSSRVSVDSRVSKLHEEMQTLKAERGSLTTGEAEQSPPTVTPSVSSENESAADMMA